MYKEIVKNNTNNFGYPFIITCQVCGFTYKIIDPKTRKERVSCPICGSNIFQKNISYYEIK